MRQFVPLLTLQSCFARRFGEAAHAPVIDVAAAVKDGAGDALLFGALGDATANLFGRRDVAAGSALPVLLRRRGGDQRDAAGVVDQLRVDVVDAAEDGQPRALARAADLSADALVDRPPYVLSAFLCHVVYPSVTSDKMVALFLVTRYS